MSVISCSELVRDLTRKGDYQGLRIMAAVIGVVIPANRTLPQ